MSLAAVTSFFLALRGGPVATGAPPSSLYPAVAAVLAAVLLRETPAASQWAGVGSPSWPASCSPVREPRFQKVANGSAFH